ncbi:hypothetical protein ACFSQ7_01800 [Paenibacillus rhizoplanae]
MSYFIQKHWTEERELPGINCFCLGRWGMRASLPAPMRAPQVESRNAFFQYSRMNIERLERGGERTVYEWHRQIQTIVDDMDQSIKQHNSEAITLQSLADKLGYSEFHTTRKFKEISGMQLRDYLRHRKLAFCPEGGKG